MDRIVVVLLFLVLSSCEQLETRKVSSEEIYSEEARELNWQEVDQYPAFRECRELIESEAAKACFETKVTRYFYSQLESKKPVVTEVLDDTLFLHLRITQNGKPKIDSVDVSDQVIEQLPKIKDWLTESVDSLPEISPATKRGIPVVTTFTMPIVIKAE